MSEVIEVYNYKIHNYKMSPSSFGGLEKSKDDNGRISVYKNGNPNWNTEDQYIQNIFLSKDPLNSIEPITNKYYKIYKNEKSKDNRLPMNKYDINYFNKLLDKVNIKYNTNITDKIGIFDDNNGYIRKINITNADKIIIFGDHHGSFHTFFRNMLRLDIYGVIDIKNYTINPGYKLIFLGDIVDRGQHSMEILEILFKFIINDTGYNIIINRGNHEDEAQMTTDGFRKEINTAIDYEQYSTLTFKKIVDFFRKCPTAVILKNSSTNRNFWLCHGYIPTNNTIDRAINSFIIDREDFYVMPYEYTNSSIMNQIRWNDPNYENNIYHTIDNEPRLAYHMCGLTRLKQFRENTNIHFIIRGHNDNYANATILSNLKSDTVLAEASHFLELGYKDYLQFILSKPLHFSWKLSLGTQYIDGSVENIFMDADWDILDKANKNDDIFTVYPVLTISTNTDIGRLLSCDSFIILHTPIYRENRNESLLKITDKQIINYLNYNSDDYLEDTILTINIVLKAVRTSSNFNEFQEKIKDIPLIDNFQYYFRELELNKLYDTLKDVDKRKTLIFDENIGEYKLVGLADALLFIQSSIENVRDFNEFKKIMLSNTQHFPILLKLINNGDYKMKELYDNLKDYNISKKLLFDEETSTFKLTGKYKLVSQAIPEALSFIQSSAENVRDFNEFKKIMLSNTQYNPILLKFTNKGDDKMKELYDDLKDFDKRKKLSFDEKTSIFKLTNVLSFFGLNKHDKIYNKYLKYKNKYLQLKNLYRENIKNE